MADFNISKDFRSDDRKQLIFAALAVSDAPERSRPLMALGYYAILQSKLRNYYYAGHGFGWLRFTIPDPSP